MINRFFFNKKNLAEEVPKKSHATKLLVVSYAFPPLQVPVSPCVAKVVSGLKKIGYSIDVVCADSFLPYLSHDNSLLPYIAESCSKVVRLTPLPAKKSFYSKCKQIFFHRVLPISDALLLKLFPFYPAEILTNSLTNISYLDPMSLLKSSSIEFLTKYITSTANFTLLITFSPFHSVNLPAIIIKKKFTKMKWIAQFSDPWANNPLEKKISTRILSKWHERQTIKYADFIIHNSKASLDLLVQRYGSAILQRSAVIPHPYDATLYPQRPKIQNTKIILRHIGTLFEDRSPEPLFAALNTLLDRRKDLVNVLALEFIGKIDPAMLNTQAAKALPPGMITHMSSVTYLKSLEKMYDADILLLIEANTKNNLFMPSKLSDYIGAGSPIVGIVPRGAAEETLEKLGGWHAHPSDAMEIATVLEKAINYIQQNSDKSSWSDEKERMKFSNKQVTLQYKAIIEKVL